MTDRLIFLQQETIAKQTKKDLLANRIIEMITSGLLRDKDVLPSERELCKLYEISRESVRAALNKVAGLGLITISHGSKTKVNASAQQLQKFHQQHNQPTNDVNQYKLEDVHQVRVAIETQVAQLVAQNISPHEVKRLKDLVKAQEGMLDDPVRFQLSDQYFHKLLAMASGNELLVKYSTELYNYNLAIRREVMSQKGAIAKSVAEHYKIIEGLENQDPNTTAANMHDHLNSVYATSAQQTAVRKKKS